ncbi:MAG: hypothetical protein GX075_03430 [Firmicutes bacterium]|nr:hypothetical protein [Bacillota bacterium]
MCGIAGWIDFTRNLTYEREVIKEMTERLTPRGPDAEGYWFSEHAALGHRRNTLKVAAIHPWIPRLRPILGLR